MNRFTECGFELDDGDYCASCKRTQAHIPMRLRDGTEIVTTNEPTAKNVVDSLELTELKIIRQRLGWLVLFFYGPVVLFAVLSLIHLFNH